MASNAPSSPKSTRTFLPAWLQAKWGNIGILFIVYILFNLAWTYFHWGGEQRVILIADLVSFAPSIFASVLAWHVAAEKSLSIQLRRAWFILGLSFLMFLFGNIIWAYLEVVLKVEPFPSVADVFYLLFYPLSLWGLISLPSTTHDRRERLTLSLDLGSVLTVAAMFVGYFIIVPTAAVSNDLLSQAIAAAYPIGSLMVIGGILAVLYRRPPRNIQSPLLYLLAGMFFFVVGDIIYGYTSLIGTYSPGHWTDAYWNVAQLFFALAALRTVQNRSSLDLTSLWSKVIAWLPFIAVALGYGLVLYVVILNDGHDGTWLMAGALLLTLLVITRQIFSSAFNDLPLRIKVILTLVMVSVLSVSLVAATAYFTIHTNLESVVGDRLKAEAEVQSQNLGDQVHKQLDLLTGFVLNETIEYQASYASSAYREGREEIGTWIKQQEAAWQAASEEDPMVRTILDNLPAQELDEFRNKFPAHSNLLLTDKFGTTIAATTRPERYSHADEDWWKAAYNAGAGGVFISDPAFVADTDRLSIVIAIPVYADHSQEVVGVIRSTYRIQKLLEPLALSDINNGRSFDLLLPGGNLLEPDGTVMELDADTLAKLDAGRNAPYTELVFEGKTQLVSQSPVVISAEDTDHLKSLNWILITHENVALAFAPLTTASRIALLATFLVLILITILAVFLAQILVAPISRLTEVAAEIAKGDLRTQANVESRDEIGTLAYTFNSMLDALSRTQQELKESEAHYRNLVDYSPDMIAVYAAGRYVFVNPAGVRMLGVTSASELIGRNVLDLVPEQARGAVEKNIRLVTTSGEPSPLMHHKMYHPDGTSFEAEYRAIPITYAGQPAIQLVARDVTERKQAEERIHELLAKVESQNGELEIRVAERTEALKSLNERLQNELMERQHLVTSLRESEERFRTLFDASPDAIFLIDPHNAETLWQIVDCNQVAGRMNGYTREELTGQSIEILNQKKSSREVFDHVLETLRHKSVFRGVEANHLHKDGYVFPIEYSTTLIKVAGHEMVLGIDRDITERKQSEEDLNKAKEAAEASRLVAETASRAKSEFLSRMSHELRTPMNAILGFAQLLEMSQKDPLTATQQERVRQIVKGGHHLLDLINEILDISRIEANRLQISPEPVSVRESIQEVLDLTVPLAVKRQIQVVTKLGSINSNPIVMADRQRLKQILLNLLSNAVKYNYDGGSVIITCQSTLANKWRISVADTGPGISEQDQARLFIPFERLVTVDQANVEGTGLGLVLAKRLAELMHGQLGFESSLRKGSTFWIELPAAESPIQQYQRTAGTGGLPLVSDVARTILYVEDNVANYELIQQVLADYNQLELVWAPDAKSGFETALRRQPDLILLDLHLGDRDGSEVLKQLKDDERTRGIPVIVITADATSGQSERLMRFGAASYLTKPINVKHFIRLIEETLGEKEF
jgi:PAS domain S-box-containing protein